MSNLDDGWGISHNAKWELDIDNIDGDISIRARAYPGLCIRYSYVHKPNFIERLLGITFENKVKKAVKKAQVKIDKLNEETECAKKLIENIKVS